MLTIDDLSMNIDLFEREMDNVVARLMDNAMSHPMIIGSVVLGTSHDAELSIP